MKVQLITHSSVLVEGKKHILLFDYFGQGHLNLKMNKPLYIFNSHAHSDHYTPAIFDIKHPKKKYILSNDIKPTHDAFMMGPHESLDIDDLHIKTLFSTDQGVGFIVEMEDKKIYFAGDLNDWHWQEDNEQDHLDNIWQHDTYLKELSYLKQDYFDIAFVPVDKRLDEHYIDGLMEFDQHVKAKYIMPIHYFGHYEISEELKKESLNLSATLLYPNHDYFTF
ncbi:MBL fold metallo-hydrolase [Sharpea azabuensis]|uniref:MBL fold metallo-hydrolase n=1 Tax=Sharpea azabuensis TaxID=322505 RepID=UPI0015690A38|nr:MBL fold metallo-hydrolase [Sharpea azabuensis]